MTRAIARWRTAAGATSLVALFAVVVGLTGALAYDGKATSPPRAQPTTPIQEAPAPAPRQTYFAPTAEPTDKPQSVAIVAPQLLRTDSAVFEPSQAKEQLARLQQQVADLQSQLQSQAEEAHRNNDLIRGLEEQVARDEEQLGTVKEQQAKAAAVEEARAQRATWYEQAGSALAQADGTLMSGTTDVAKLLSTARGDLQSAAGSAVGNSREGTDVQVALDRVSAAEESLANSDLAGARVAILAATRSVVAAGATTESSAEPLYGP
jgi:hypothetical protein